jgi:hypothetical protein
MARIPLTLLLCRHVDADADVRVARVAAVAAARVPSNDNNFSHLLSAMNR